MSLRCQDQASRHIKGRECRQWTMAVSTWDRVAKAEKPWEDSPPSSTHNHEIAELKGTWQNPPP